ncbi:t13 [Tupaiid betaherpesvirus 1]|uniref:T13 n=1 Tax=Tupaiid herpesvirus 1 (strain 1) TaxID=10397 RepID=Q91TV0_TUHV1|nr:t13 [Tupaiid betaherpesvirus 1]AAK57037.1 t13 [Tupaiid betaherpesvirus 1]
MLSQQQLVGIAVGDRLHEQQDVVQVQAGKNRRVIITGTCCPLRRSPRGPRRRNTPAGATRR